MKVLRKETAIKIKDMMIRAAEREGHMEVQRVLRGAINGDGNTERGASALYDLWEEVDNIRYGIESDLLQLMTDITFDGPVYTRLQENAMESRFKVLTEGAIGSSMEEGYNDSNMQSHNGRTDNAPHHRKENLFQAYARAAMAAAFPDGGRIDPEIKKRAVRRIRQAYRSLKEKGTVNDRMGGEAYAALGTKIGKLISRHLAPEKRYGD